MITKERLEELIEQGATIYGIDDRWDIVEVRELDAQQIYYSSSNVNYQYVFDDHSVVEFFDDKLFETKEDAEEYVEFGNITKTIQLNYVSWEEFKNQDRNFSFRAYPYDYYCYTDGRYVEIKEYYRSSDRVIFSKKLTRENYNEARRLCVKLFKGESV